MAPQGSLQSPVPMSNSNGGPGRPPEPARQAPEMNRGDIQPSTPRQENGAEGPSFATTAPMCDTELLRGVAPGAHVWAAYLQETGVYDKELVERWNRSLELTLVFAALFSAIVTAFVLESVKLLRPDSGQETTAALVNMSQALSRIATGQPLTLKQPQADASGRMEFRPPSHSVWINSLFFLSLGLSIAASLAAMLAKQWCYNFLSGRTGDAIDQVETRQAMFNGVEKWKMGGIVELVPVLMHLSLGIFWAGLVLYLWDINIAVAVVVTITAGLTACFYFGTMLLSAMVKHCPFVTPQGEWVRHGIKAFGTLILGPKASRYTTLLAMVRRHLRRLAPVFQRSSNDPHSLGNGPSSPGLFAGIALRFSTSTQQDGSPLGRPFRTPVDNRTEVDNVVNEQNGTPCKNHPEFIPESLSWLITHSRDSTTIGTAIGAWVIAKLETKKTPRESSTDTAAVDLEQYMKSFLVNRFSACFSTSPEFGVKLKLLDDSTHLSAALDYTRWITYFAKSSIAGIEAELEALSKLKTFGQSPFIHLGLAFASLADSQALSSHDAVNVLMWLSAFTSLYHTNKALFTSRAISTIIEGIAVASLKLTVSRDSGERRELASNMGIPHLVQILSTINPVNPGELQLRSSIVLSLAVFALKAKFAYPFDLDQERYDSEALQLVRGYQSRELPLDCEGYAPFVVFSLVGLIHPESQIDLIDEETTRIICKIVQETSFFSAPLYGPTKPIHPIIDQDSFRHHMARMLIETMILTPATRNLPHHTVRKNATPPSSSLILQEALMAGCAAREGSQMFPSTLQAVCKLIWEHFRGIVTLYPGVLFAATDLLLQEVKNLDKLNFRILVCCGGFYMPMPPPWIFSEAPDSSASSTDTLGEWSSLPAVASSTLARIMTEATDLRCFEVVVRAIIYHSKGHSAASIVEVINLFADWFCAPNLGLLENEALGNGGNGPNEDQKETEQERQVQALLMLSGYSRLVASMIRHSSDSTELSNLLGALASQEGNNWKLKLENVRKVLDRLVNTTTNTQVSAFAVAGLAVWDLSVLSMLPTPMDLRGSRHKTTDLLPKTWDIIEKHSLNRNKLPPEAIEDLLITTVQLAADLPKVPKVEPAHAQIILELIAQSNSNADAQLKPALAVVVAFWGLSLDEPGWEFWEPNARQGFWEQYRHLTSWHKDTAALLLIGLSRILFHYSTLQLSHKSINTIAHAIHNHMSTYSRGSENLALDFLSPGLKFDVRRHVRESVWQYLEETEVYKPFSRSINDVRELLRTAVAYDGGEGYAYEAPQPFIRTKTPEEKSEDASE